MKRALINNTLIISGLIAIGRGLWLVYPPSCYVVIGAILVMAAARNTGKHV